MRAMIPTPNGVGTGGTLCERRPSYFAKVKAMDKDRIKGKVKQVEGKVQEAAGVLTDSNKTKLKGKMKVAEGKVQESYGDAKDSVRKAIK